MTAKEVKRTATLKQKVEIADLFIDRLYTVSEASRAMALNEVTHRVFNGEALKETQSRIKTETFDPLTAVHGLYVCKVRGLEYVSYAILKLDDQGWWQYWRGGQQEGWVGNDLEVLEVIQLIEPI